MRKMTWGGRGRPRGSHHPRFNIRILEYLVELATKHGISTREFFAAIVKAWENGKATCKGLNIQCREKKRDCAIFLITKGRAVIAQFPIQERVLKETNPLKGFDYVRERVKHASKMKERKLHENHHMQIADLKAGMKKINLRARVIEISKPKLVQTRFFDYVAFANATLADETGKIDLPLWNGRINTISIDDIVQIKNANVIMFRGEKQLRIGRNGRLEVVETNPIHALQQVH
ncbi:MAG: hypothetical protein PVF15_04490 [Candidatus Bathyarchaeota archaeon]|jgi:hypothetical protein